ncbi:alpha/beta hydrolase [Streptomyces sp. CAI-121]|uniref:alpha/beta hydrolase family protein n=1 Tax=unclassified Streptomyces TaxID=2593676 RepID=UPI0015872003|nr:MULTISPECIES: alpha/beta hydrolase [unclassified Streptomyces]NUV71929.1 alpha/beta hydrolase [Streptomyces sp. CAI-121]NUW16817.1 alpha/beta hydrolase [Streptomyces sp. CAI-68]
MTISLRNRRAGAAATATALALASLAALAGTATPASASGWATTAASAPEAAAFSSASGDPAAVSALTLPRPTGSYATGRDTLFLTDHERTDPWVPAAGARRLLVSLHYPARPGSGGDPAPYMPEAEARLMLAQRGLDDPEWPGMVAATRTFSRTDARPAPGRFPLVLLSPGFGTPRATLTGLAEELASRGYVVATADHPYESTGTELPDGRVLTCAACDEVDAQPDEAGRREVLAAVATGRAADFSFLLDRLTGPRPAWRHAGTIDARRVGMAGHSIGGNAAASTMAADRRVDAGVNLDGTFFDPVTAGGLDGRPFLMLGTDPGHAPGGDTSWDEGWDRLDGFKRWLTVRDSGHFTFTDTPVIGEQLGIVDPEAPLSAARSATITRAYVTAFFDRSLRGRPTRLLDGPTPAHPEVLFQHP